MLPPARRLADAGHAAADLHLTSKHECVERRPDRRVLELRSRLLGRCLHLRDSGLAAFDVSLGALDAALGDAVLELAYLELIAWQEATLEQRLRALERAFLELDGILVEIELRGRVLQFRLPEVRLGLVERRLRDS